MMNPLSLVLVACFTVIGLGSAGTAGVADRAAEHAQSRSDSAQVLAAIEAYDAAWNSKDAAAVAGWLHPDYRYFSSAGEVLSRERMLEFLQSPDYIVVRAYRSELGVVHSGETGVASSRWVGRGSFAGEAFDDDQRCSLVLLRSDSDWRILAEHCTQIRPRDG